MLHQIHIKRNGKLLVVQEECDPDQHIGHDQIVAIMNATVDYFGEPSTGGSLDHYIETDPEFLGVK